MPTASDQEGEVSLLSGPTSGFRIVSEGVEVVEYIFVDESGNIATCTFNITVTSKEL